MRVQCISHLASEHEMTITFGGTSYGKSYISGIPIVEGVGVVVGNVTVGTNGVNGMNATVRGHDWGVSGIETS